MFRPQVRQTIDVHGGTAGPLYSRGYLGIQDNQRGCYLMAVDNNPHPVEQQWLTLIPGLHWQITEYRAPQAGAQYHQLEIVATAVDQDPQDTFQFPCTSPAKIYSTDQQGGLQASSDIQRSFHRS